MKIILYDNDGICAVVFPAYKDKAAYHSDELAYLVDTYSNGDNLLKHQITKPFTDEEILQRVIETAIPSDVAYKVVEFDQIQDAIIDRTFRNAWCFCKKQGVRVDMVKAREIHRNKLRRHREPLLAKLDVQFMRASEIPYSEESASQKAAILQKKQFLRDLPAAPEIEKAQTPEELKNFDPLIDFALD